MTFGGDCETAFNFYKSVFGGEFSYVGRFKEMPPQEGQPAISADEGDRIMHISLPISEETVLLGSDTGGEWSKSFAKGNNLGVSIKTIVRQKQTDFLQDFRQAEKITMPIANTFWGSYFGMFTDKFGINWMVNFEQANQKK